MYSNRIAPVFTACSPVIVPCVHKTSICNFDICQGGKDAYNAKVTLTLALNVLCQRKPG